MKRSCTMDTENEIPNKVALVERNIRPQGIQLLDPTAVAKASKQDLIALATEIQKADSYVKANACNKLQVIAEQMRFLKQQAEKVLLEAEHNAKLHHAACNFIKHPGRVYHLYERESGQYYFSMLSPEEWGSSGAPHSFKGSFRLEQDQSWTPVQQTESKDVDLAILSKFFPDDATSSLIRSLNIEM